MEVSPWLTMREKCEKLARRTRVVKAGRVTEVYEYVAHAMPRPSAVKGWKPPTRRADASLRAKRMVRWLSAGNGEVGTSYFFTATFADDVRDYDTAVIRWERFRRLMRRQFEDMRYIAVPEVQPRSGRWHFHAIFCGLPTERQFLEARGWAATRNGKRFPQYKIDIQTMWSEANGHTGKIEYGGYDRCDIQVARSVGGVCGYLIKYLNKSVGGTVPAGRRNYYAGGPRIVRPVILEGEAHVPKGEPVFGAAGRDRQGYRTAFRRFVEPLT